MNIWDSPESNGEGCSIPRRGVFPSNIDSVLSLKVRARAVASLAGALISSKIRVYLKMGGDGGDDDGGRISQHLPFGMKYI